MKNNVKFLILVLSLILLSACTLSTGMYAVKEISEAPEDYEFSEQSFKFESGENENVSESGPTPQELLLEKFSAMYEIDEENNAITVISRDYYESYWAEKNGKAEIVSLTSDEVLFIIQDSINLYCKYGKIILNIFDGSSDKASYEIIPLTGDTIGGRFFPAVERDGGIEEWMLDDISRIIIHRISSLSSPEAFISCKELAEYADVKVGNSLDYYLSKLYFPGLKDMKEREDILEEYKQLQYSSSVHWMEYREVICFKPDGWRNNFYMSVESSGEGATSFFGYNFEKVIPTDETYKTLRAFWNKTNYQAYISDYVDDENFGTWFLLRKNLKSFMIGSSSEKNIVFKGRYEITENELVLKLYEMDEEIYRVDNSVGKIVFDLVEDKYIFSYEKSSKHLKDILSITNEANFELVSEKIKRPMIKYMNKECYGVDEPWLE